jgi:chemotaxis response regulator CheB
MPAHTIRAMDASSWSSLVIAAALGGGIAWFGARWWFGRQFAELRAQAGKAENARQVALQQSQQVRKQIDQLQKDISSLQRKKPVAKAAAPDPAKDRAARMAEAESLLAAAAAADGPDTIRAAFPEHGFADTQPTSRL